MSRKGIPWNMPLRERFNLQWQAVPNGCWEWTGHISTVCYGQIKDDYRSRHAHRVSWELHQGPILDGLCVCHTCDNRRCVNPSHLFLATNAGNTADKVRKGRQARNERHGLSKLTPAQVLEIRASKDSPKAIAPRYGISWSQVYRIRRGLFWRVGNIQ